MSLLQKVESELNANPHVLIARRHELIHPPGVDSIFQHEVDLWVAPKVGIYTEHDLNEFLVTLTKTPPSNITRFKMDRSSVYPIFHQGFLTFNEHLEPADIDRVYGIDSGVQTGERTTSLFAIPCLAYAKDTFPHPAAYIPQLDLRLMKRYEDREST